MQTVVRRIFIEKKNGFDVEASRLKSDVRESLSLSGLKDVRIINRYDIEGISEEEYKKASKTIFAEVNVDNISHGEVEIENNYKSFVVEFLPGQYDQRADSAEQCVQILTTGEKPIVKTAKVVAVEGDLSDKEVEDIKKYYINVLESREASWEKPESLEMEYNVPEAVDTIDGFIDMNDEQVADLAKEIGLAMNVEDLKHCREYFKSEDRNPTITEIRVIDTYWSDHCRHTTFETVIDEVKFEDNKLVKPVEETYKEYCDIRKEIYVNKNKHECLMDVAVIGMKELKRQGKLDDLDQSDEINACSIVVNAEVDGKDEEWLVMFKNETHNHPTEIEPFGGASTCLGGAIRDPLSGRSYVYQAMRVTGSADPTKGIEETLPGKLPQKKITRGAAKGYSSYGNQIGLATGIVEEVYHEGYMAKRMEVGGVIGAAPRENVVRRKPIAGDKIVLLGGRTGRDGIGGASGSSKEHTEDSLTSCGAEVQKGNAPTERKIQRLFRDSKVTKLIVKCNDFGAGGVSVAIGELADGLIIDLDKVPKKYQGLDGTELAISESQERMAVVIPSEKVEEFVACSHKENLEATVVAEVTEENRLVMNWNGQSIVDVSRDFLDTNGVLQHTKIEVVAPSAKSYFETRKEEKSNIDVKKAWESTLKDLNSSDKKGLVEMFDSTIGTGTVLMPYGGKYMGTKTDTMVAKLPVLKGDTTTVSMMTYGFDPHLSSWSTYHGAVYAVVDSLAKIVATGGDYKKVRLSFQEYFEKLGNDPVKWGKPFSALLGGLKAQMEFGTAAIGGKDSMSGTFKDITVPPTLISFAVCTGHIDNVISPEFKEVGNKVVLVEMKRDENDLPLYESARANFEVIHNLIKSGDIKSAKRVGFGGVAETITSMALGNRIGAELLSTEDYFTPNYGSIVVEVAKDANVEELFKGATAKVIGSLINETSIVVKDTEIKLTDANEWNKGTLEKIFPTEVEQKGLAVDKVKEFKASSIVTPKIEIAKPKVFIPVFPGTNCEYDSIKAFEKAGAEVEHLVFNNLSSANIKESIDVIAEKISKSQIVMLPGGFSAGDEPDGSGKFIATTLRNPKIMEAVMEMLNSRDGLMMGICNGFQALIKLGLVPSGEITDIAEDAPTLTYNEIGRHVSQIVNTKIVSNKSPWLQGVEVGDIHRIPVSHGEGRFVASEEVARKLFESGQVATVYVDNNGNPTEDIAFNPNGSVCAIEGITSPDGRVFGKMGHSERIGNGLYKNIYGEMDQKLFESGVKYFK